MTKNKNFLYLDFEFHPSPHRYIEVFCGASWFAGESKTWNFLDAKEKEDFYTYVMSLPNPLTLVAYGIDAELRCLASLFEMDRPGPKFFDSFICLHREFKLLCNRNREMVYGDVISKKGKIKRQFKGGVSSTGDEDKKYIHLLNALWKICGIYQEKHVRSKDLYTRMCALREIAQIHKNMEGLKKYCAMDTDLLPHLFKGIWEYHDKKHPFSPWQSRLATMEKRGAYGELISYKVQKGYYVKPQEVVTLITNAPSVSNEIAREILHKWPDKKTFSWDKKLGRYVQHADVIRKYIRTEAPSHVAAQFKTSAKTKNVSLDKDTFEKLFPNKHALDPNNYLQQIYRYRHTFDSLKGISLYSQNDTSKTPKFGNYYDHREGVVRPHFNDFGSQTSRNQPRSNGYLLLKPAWMRNLLKPPPGHCMMVSDISQEEVLILAVLSGDSALLEDYNTGDLYSSYGVRTGAMTGLEKGSAEWKIMRQAIKAIILGIMYGKGSKALAFDLTEITKRRITQQYGQIEIDKFWRTYPQAKHFTDETWTNYRKFGVAVLDSGWTMWSANYNRRSVVNYPMQGFGAEVMREVDFELDKMGLWSPLSLHDAFAVYCPLVDNLPNLETAAKITIAIRKGFEKALSYRPGVGAVRNDMKIFWSEYLKEMALPPKILVDRKEVKVEYDCDYNDERAGVDLKAFGKFFKPQLVQ